MLQGWASWPCLAGGVTGVALLSWGCSGGWLASRLPNTVRLNPIWGGGRLAAGMLPACCRGPLDCSPVDSCTRMSCRLVILDGTSHPAALHPATPGVQALLVCSGAAAHECIGDGMPLNPAGPASLSASTPLQTLK